MTKKLTNQEKEAFLLRNGWASCGLFKYRRVEWENNTQFDYFEVHLDSAYESEMECEYDRVLELLKRANNLMDINHINRIGMDEWRDDYKKWSKT